MYNPKTTMMSRDGMHEESKKSVRINDKAQDLREVHAARLSLKLRRMKRKLFLEALADDPANSGYSSASLATSSSSSSSLREDDDGESAFRRGRLVRYNAGSGSVVFGSSSSVYSDLTETDLNEINHVIEQRRDDISGY